MGRETQQLAATGAAGNVNTDFTFTGINPWQVVYGRVVLTTDATVANRRVIIQSLDSANKVLFEMQASVTHPASQTDENHEYLPGVGREAAEINNTLLLPIPKKWMFIATQKLRVSINAGVAGDSYEADFSAIEIK